MGRNVAYGFANTNRSDIEPSATLAYKELEIFNAEEIVVDVHWHSENREKLEELISNMGQGDLIYMYSLDTLLRGKNKGVEYYKRIIEKNIDLLIFDHSGDLLKTSPVSTFIYGGEEVPGRLFSEEKKAKLIQTMEALAATYVPLPQTGKTTSQIVFTQKFKEFYFDYESYRLPSVVHKHRLQGVEKNSDDKETFEELLLRRTGISSKQTFMALCRAYERSPHHYFNDFEDYVEEDPKILQLPKRAGKIPKEYDEIMQLAASMPGVTEKERIQRALDEMRIISNADIFYRWKLAKEKVPKPRAFDGRIVNHPKYVESFLERQAKAETK